MPQSRQSGIALNALVEMEKEGREVCEHAGHDYAEAGGGLLICTVCTSEKWEDEHDA
jgi:hypothetical protein